MRDYGTVRPQFWTRGTGKALRGDPDAQRLALYLLTCPAAHMTGLYYLPLPTVCHEIGMDLDGARKGLARLSQEGFAEYDEPTEVVFVINMAREQIGGALVTGDNRWKGVWRHVGEFSKHKYYQRFVALYSECYRFKEWLKLEGASKGLSRPSRARARVPALDPVPDPVPNGSTRAKSWRRVPPEWQPKDDHTRIALEHGRDLKSELARFRDHEFKTPKTDADAAFRNWLRRSSDFGSGRPQQPTEPPSKPLHLVELP